MSTIATVAPMPSRRCGSASTGRPSASVTTASSFPLFFVFSLFFCFFLFSCVRIALMAVRTLSLCFRSGRFRAGCFRFSKAGLCFRLLFRRQLCSRGRAVSKVPGNGSFFLLAAVRLFGSGSSGVRAGGFPVSGPIDVPDGSFLFFRLCGPLFGTRFAIP